MREDEQGSMPERGIRAGVRRLLRLRPRARHSIFAEVDEELQCYLEARIEYLVARGMSRQDAHAEALRRLGGTIEEARERLHQSAEHRERRMRLTEWFDDLLQDVHYAARSLVRRPAFTAVAVLTLAIGIGATTAIFSAVNALIFRPLPFARPDELMKVSLVAPDRSARKGSSDMVWSYPKFVAFRDAQQVFADLSLYAGAQFTLTSGEVEQVRGEFVGARYFPTLGISPARGRNFDASIDAHPNAPRQVIIADALWQRRFNADPAIIGKTIGIDREPYDIIGVAPGGFKGLTGQADFFIPVTTRGADDLGEAQSHEFSLVARRKTGASVEQAVAATALLGKRVNEAFPDRGLGSAAWSAKAVPLDDTRVAPLVRRSLFVLLGAVAFVLLIACVNVASLLLGRASVRQREIAVRLAIGAGRGRLVRLLLTESILLSVVGAIASVAVAWWGTHALSGVNPATTLRVQRLGALGAVGFSSIHLDGAALLFALAVAVLVGALFGLAPALHATRASVSDALKDGTTGARRPRTVSGRNLLVVTEVALALVLLVGSGLMIRSLAKLLAVDTGFDARNVLTLRLTFPLDVNQLKSSFRDAGGGLLRDSLPGFYDQMLERLRAVPGVTDASLTDCAPLSGGCNGTVITFMDRPPTDLAHSPSVGVHWATPSWFSTVHVPLKRGRFFGPADRMGAPKVVLVSETAAREFWPNESPLGKRVGLGQGGFGEAKGGAEVVGVVGDVRQSADSAAKPDVYLPYHQSPRPAMMIFVRTSGNPAALGTAVRRAIHDLAPRYPVYDMEPMTARAAAATAQARFSALLLGLFAAVSLSLAALGIYGVMSLTVQQRTREIGIRMALGADAQRVMRMVVGQGTRLATIGAVIGLAGALVCTRVLRALLFDVKPSDPITYVAIVALIGVAACAASWLPARRATRVQPTDALREG